MIFVSACAHQWGDRRSFDFQLADILSDKQRLVRYGQTISIGMGAVKVPHGEG